MLNSFSNIDDDKYEIIVIEKGIQSTNLIYNFTSYNAPNIIINKINYEIITLEIILIKTIK